MKLSAVQLDAIQELGNIGAAHAATTLSQMVMSEVEIKIPQIRVIDLAELKNYVGEEPAALVVFELRGDIPHGGYIIFYLTQASAIRLTNAVLGKADLDPTTGGLDESVLLEVGNIMASAFLDATAELLSLLMLPSPPALTIDMAHAAIQSLIAQMTEEIDEVMLFLTEIVCEEHRIEGSIILMPETSTLHQILGILEKLAKSP